MGHLSKWIIVTASLFFFTSCASTPEMTLDQYLEQNNALAISYLQSLDDTQLQKTLSGIKLTDGTPFLNDHIYIRSSFYPETKSHIFIFRESETKSKVAYIWVDGDGKPFPLPANCNPGYIHSPGWSAAVLSTDVYTFSDVMPGGDLVSTHCIENMVQK